MAAPAAKALLVESGMKGADAERAFAPEHVSQEGSDTVVVPGDEFIRSLDTPTRQAVYPALRGRGVSAAIDYPYVFPDPAYQAILADTRLDPSDVALLKKLVFRVGDAAHLCDYETLLRAIPVPGRRIDMLKAMSRQSAVLVRMCVRPDTDVDKVANYWGHVENVRFNDVRPLLESLRDQPKGGTLSIVYFLPPFARDRLYTYPIRRPGDPGMDCHWTTFNFSNLQLDDRFDDADFATRYLMERYYTIGAPSVYGDIVLLLDDKNLIRHSAVFLADDLVFTKYGRNEQQPWMIVHIADMLAAYPGTKLSCVRRRTN